MIGVIDPFRSGVRRVLFGCLMLCLAGSMWGADTVTLQLKWTHAFQFAGYYAAEDQGYYRDAGLNVRIEEALPGVDPVDAVLAGKARYGVSDSSILLRRHEGKPLVVIAVVFQHSALVLVALRKGTTQTLHDLAGKRLMITPNDDELHALLRLEGLLPGSYTAVESSFDIQDLVSGEADAFSSYITDQTYTLDRAGIPYIAYSPRTAGIDFYGDNLYTTEDEIRDYPDRVKAFRRASLRGWKYAMEHPEEVADLILDRYSRVRDRESLLYEANQMVPLIEPMLVEMGYMHAGRWRHIADTYADLGMLPPEYPLEGFLYDPNPERDLRWVYRGLLGTISGIVVIGFIAFRFIRLSRALMRQKQFLDAIVENAPECVMVLNRSGEVMRMNRAGFGMLEVEDLADIRKVGLVNLIHPDFRDAFADLNERVCSGESRQLTFASVGKNGTGRWLEGHATPLRDRGKSTPLLLAVVRDITARKEAEAALEAAHRELLNVSRRAGMAEVATGVLHNIGNVLNSVNVSVTLVSERVKRSQSENLGKVAALLRRHEADLGGFIANQQQGKQLPAFLETIAEHMEAERAAILEEVDSLRKNVQHIKHVVAMQQTHAKPSGVKECVGAEELIEESLRMNAGALARRRIRVAREFDPVPAIEVDKHRVMQILVNLIRNACEASTKGAGLLTLRLSNGNGSVRIAVSDNGAGVSREDLPRIFRHGFTTKSDGHGFGLHSGALAAKEMGGSISVHSDGPGTGATFTLELPVGTGKKHHEQEQSESQPAAVVDRR